MVRREFSLPSSDGKTALHAVAWRPEGAVRAVLQIAHGVAEHILRYEGLASYLTERGVAVAGHDHLGHGTSLPEGGAALYFGPRGSWDLVVEDLYRLGRSAEGAFPGVPRFLLGHSMGSFLVRSYLIRYPGTVRGAVLMGTGWTAPPVLAAGLAAAEAECARLGEDRPSPLVNQLAFGPYRRPFAPCRTDLDWLSANAENVDRYIADPLCGGAVTGGLFRELLSGIRAIQRPAALRRMNRNTPVLFLSGGDDPVGAMGRGVSRTERAFRRAGVRDVTRILYPGLRHELLHEVQRELVCADLFRWMEARL